MAKSSNWCFTDFRGVAVMNGYKKLFEENGDVIRGISWGRETCPKTNKKHCQGYVQFFKQKTMGQVKIIFGNKALHLEIMHGSIESNDVYCSKENDYERLGVYVSVGTRTDLENLKTMIDSGADREEIASIYTNSFLKYQRGIDKLYEMRDKRENNKWRDLDVTILIGKPGHGKTRYAVDLHGYDKCFIMGNKANKNFLFDGYDGEDVLIIDDFYGWIKYSELLTILDGHPYRCNIKGSFRFAKWTKVYLTSNLAPGFWYVCGSDALERRIKSVLKVERGNTIPFPKPWDRITTEREEKQSVRSILSWVD